MGGPFVAGIVASAVSGFVVIAFLLRYLRRHDFAHLPVVSGSRSRRSSSW